MKDSLQFLNCGLNKLVANLNKKGMKEGKLLKDTFPTAYSYFKKKCGKLYDGAFERVSTLMNTLIHLKDSMNQNYQKRRNTTAF